MMRILTTLALALTIASASSVSAADKKGGDGSSKTVTGIFNGWNGTSLLVKTGTGHDSNVVTVPTDKNTTYEINGKAVGTRDLHKGYKVSITGSGDVASKVVISLPGKSGKH